MAERQRCADTTVLLEAWVEADDLLERVEELEGAIRAHMAAVDASRPLPVRAFDRALWRTVVPDGVTDWERRYGGC
jgi:hypothetical protein